MDLIRQLSSLKVYWTSIDQTMNDHGEIRLIGNNFSVLGGRSLISGNSDKDTIFHFIRAAAPPAKIITNFTRLLNFNRLIKVLTHSKYDVTLTNLLSASTE